MNVKEKPYRGYISSHMLERSVPQNVQQIVIRDYCKRNNMRFLLSATEYVMKGCTMMLNAVLQEDIAGIVFYSIYLLPECERKRQAIYTHAGNKEFHFAAENIILRTKEDVSQIEDVFLLRNAIINSRHLREIENWL